MILITNVFVYKENLVIQSLKFTFYLIEFFFNFLSYYILISFYFLSIFILLTRRTKLLKLILTFFKYLS